MNRITFYLTFLFNSKNRLMTIVEAKWNNEMVNLSKSSFMLFLYNNENEINEKDLDFSYRLTKYLKNSKLQMMFMMHFRKNLMWAGFFQEQMN